MARQRFTASDGSTHEVAGTDPNERLPANIRRELQEALDEITPLLSDYPSALKRWAEAEKHTGQNYAKLTEVLLKGLAGEEIPDEQLRLILAQTNMDVDTKSAWKSLERAGAAWDHAIRRIARAADRYVTYRAYEEGMGTAKREYAVGSILRPYADENGEVQ